jgi:16S rRNA A1518/A1519 N6-dimethyltransferase RsmA/KsgA/DIM1 with predicted DNA glycosylase/AP lyase activity
MFKLLKQNWPQERVLAAFKDLELAPQIRAEQVSLEQFAELARFFS